MTPYGWKWSASQKPKTVPWPIGIAHCSFTAFATTTATIILPSTYIMQDLNVMPNFRWLEKVLIGQKAIYLERDWRVLETIMSFFLLLNKIPVTLNFGDH